MPALHLKQGAIDWLKLTGDSVNYQSSLTGQSKTIVVTLEQDVATMDDEGMVVRGLTINLNPVDIPYPDRGDIVSYSDGRRFRVDAILDSPGYLTRAFVSPS